MCYTDWKAYQRQSQGIRASFAVRSAAMDTNTVTVPYSYYDLVRTHGLVDAMLPDVDFPPPSLTPLRKPLSKSTLGMYVSCGLYLKTDPPPGRTNDLRYRLIDRAVPLTDLGIG